MSPKSTPKRTETYPNPDDTNPASADSLNLGEAPVAVRSNDGRDELGNAEGDDQGSGRPLHEEEPMRTGNEDQRLRDDGDLEIDDHVQLPVVRIGAGTEAAVRERDAELVFEEGRFDDDDDEDDPVVMRTNPKCQSNPFL